MSLPDLLGWWADTRGSEYVLHLDTPNSLSVTTRRPDGGSRHTTKGLITQDASGAILWSTHFVARRTSVDGIEWMRLDGTSCRPFVWKRNPRRFAPPSGTTESWCQQNTWIGRREDDVYLSKALSTLLRHLAVKVGIAIRPDGFCFVSDVLRAEVMLGASVEDVERVVRLSDKQRYEVRTEDGELLIRARQGHSMPEVRDDQLLRRLKVDDDDLPEVCVHCTFKKHLRSILCVGLLPGGTRGSRNHVHFVPYEPGWQGRTDLAIYLHLPVAVADGVPFFISSNDVILSPGVNGVISAGYIYRIRDLETNMDLPLDLEIQHGSGSGPRDVDLAQLTIEDERLERVLGAYGQTTVTHLRSGVVLTLHAHRAPRDLEWF